ncbi:serine hydrolase domain-containing protein [Myroides sp. LJL116]
MKSGIVLVTLFFFLCFSVKSFADKPLISLKVKKQNNSLSYKSNLDSLGFKSLTNKVDSLAKNTLEQGNINSLAIAIYSDGFVYQQYYPVIDMDNKTLATKSPLYEIASISKVFLGSLTAKAVLEGKIKLSDDITTYLSGQYTNLVFQGKPVTIENLVTHSMGMDSKAPKKLAQIYQDVAQGYYQDKAFDYSMEDFLQELKDIKLDKPPGEVYQYNSVGPEVMAYILEKVYDKPYRELLEEFLIQLDLKQTFLLDDNYHQKPIAVSFDSSGNIASLLRNPLLGGSYGMISTLEDLTKFMVFQLQANPLWIKESSRLLFVDQEHGDDKGYFWDVGYGKTEGAYYGKTGTSNGVQSGILICPDSHYGMIIIMNNTSEIAQDNWEELYNKVETELIRYSLNL